MNRCRSCNAPLDDDALFCRSCGSPVDRAQPQAQPQPQVQPQPQQSGAPEQAYSAPTPPPPQYGNGQYGQSVPPHNGAYRPPFVPDIDTSGVLVWSILCTVFCLPLGLVALIMTLGIKNAPSQEEAERKKRNVKIVCMISTVLAAVLLVLSIVLFKSIISDPYMYYGY